MSLLNISEQLIHQQQLDWIKHTHTHTHLAVNPQLCADVSCCCRECRVNFNLCALYSAASLNFLKLCKIKYYNYCLIHNVQVKVNRAFLTCYTQL